MKAIILAAGLGSRLKSVDLPKGLTLLSSGQTILQRQVDILLRHLPLEDLTIVVGFHQEKIKAAFPKIQTVENRQYAQENTSKSLLKALPTKNEDTLWINGDVVFHEDAVKAILKNPQTSMIVTKDKCDPEAVKYQKDPAGFITKVSKEVQNPLGEAVGINLMSGKDLELFRTSLKNCKDTDYFEKGIEMCIEKGMKVKGIPIPSNWCIEIDFPEDLKKAESLLKLWSE